MFRKLHHEFFNGSVGFAAVSETLASFFVLNTDLREWLSEHGALLPSFLQNQISLGRDISGKVTKVSRQEG